jgi:hypothetical protein
MTRFAELRRINRAIEQKNELEIRRGITYCEMRLRIAAMKEHRRTYSKLPDKLHSASRRLNQENWMIIKEDQSP